MSKRLNRLIAALADGKHFFTNARPRITHREIEETEKLIGHLQLEHVHGTEKGSPIAVYPLHPKDFKQRAEEYLEHLCVAMVLALLLVVSAQGQQPASYAYGSLNLATARQLGFSDIGIGGGLGFSANLPKGFTLRDDFSVIRERKQFERSGTTVANYTALRAYTPETSNQFFADKALFGEIGIQVTSHTNLPTATRLNVGGGLVIIDQISWMPRLEAKIVGVKALRDIHGLNGIKTSIASYHNFSASPFGIFGEVTSACGRFHDVGTTKSRGAFSGEIRVGFFVNLTAIKGA